MLALTVYEATLCACGFPPEVADTDPDLQVKYRHCPVCAGLAKVARLQHAEDEKVTKKLGEKPPPDADLPGDGRRLIGLEPRTTE